MSDRLDELQRQRALLAQHLAWLDREIEAAKARHASAPGIARSPSPFSATSPNPLAPPGSHAPALARALAAPAISAPASTPVAPPAGASEPETDGLLDEYRVAPENVHADVRKGCFLYFAIALLLLAAGVTALYFLVPRSERPAPKSAPAQKSAP